MLKIIINGINGKIGRVLYSIIEKCEDITVAAGIDKFIAKDLNVTQYKSLNDCKEKADVIVDFSRPDATGELLNFALERKIPLVIATTGQSPDQQSAILLASKEIPIFQASNMSLGINLLIELSKKAGRFLGTSYDIEIIEQHHNQKVDAPSGTALSIANAINDEVYAGKKFFKNGRENKNEKRKPDEIGIHAIRGGNIVGKHSVMFIGNDEIIDISHEAQSRQVFAYGALKAARFICDKAPGYYGMKDIIGKEYSVTTVFAEPSTAFISLKNASSKVISEVLDELDKGNVNIDMIAKTLNEKNNSDITFTLPEKDFESSCKMLKNKGFDFSAKKGLSKITVEGLGMEHSSGIAKKVLNIFKNLNIEIYAITTSKNKITCLSDGKYEEKILKSLKEAFNI